MAVEINQHQHQRRISFLLHQRAPCVTSLRIYRVLSHPWLHGY